MKNVLCELLTNKVEFQGLILDDISEDFILINDRALDEEYIGNNFEEFKGMLEWNCGDIDGFEYQQIFNETPYIRLFFRIDEIGVLESNEFNYMIPDVDEVFTGKFKVFYLKESNELIGSCKIRREFYDNYHYGILLTGFYTRILDGRTFEFNNKKFTVKHFPEVEYINANDDALFAFNHETLDIKYFCDDDGYSDLEYEYPTIEEFFENLD